MKDAGYEQARGGAQATYYAVGAGESFDRFNVDCRVVSSTDRVSQWVRPGCWHILMFHGIGDQQDGWAPISVVQFTELMAELARFRDDGGVEVLPFSQAVGRILAPSQPCADVCAGGA